MTPDTVTERVIPGGRLTRFVFDADIACETAGTYRVLWTATIDALENAISTNDDVGAETVVVCRESSGRRTP